MEDAVIFEGTLPPDDTVIFEGKEYILIDQAYPFEGRLYEGRAYLKDDEETEYRVIWETSDYFEERVAYYNELIKKIESGIKLTPEEKYEIVGLENYVEDSESCCDWDRPISVKPI